MKHDDVTIVLQGPLHTKGGSLCRGIHNIPTYMKFVGASIISTWKNDGIKPTKRFLARNNTTYIEDDPEKYSKVFNWMNVNFQVISSLNGMRKVKTKYVIKVRCDEKYEDMSVFIKTMKENPEMLTTQEPFYRHVTKKKYISDHVMGGLTTKMTDMFEEAYEKCEKFDVPRKDYAPEDLLKRSFDGDNVWVSIFDFGDFLFKIQTDRITRAMLRRMKEISPDTPMAVRRENYPLYQFKKKEF